MDNFYLKQSLNININKNSKKNINKLNPHSFMTYTLRRWMFWRSERVLEGAIKTRVTAQFMFLWP